MFKDSVIYPNAYEILTQLQANSKSPYFMLQVEALVTILFKVRS